mgnify:FL=1
MQVTQKVFERCGTPRLGRRSAQSSAFVFEKRLEKIHRTPARPAKSEFELLLTDLKKQLKGVEGFWSLLPYQMCDTQVEKPYRHVRDRDSCWNGQDVGSYTEKVLEDGLENQFENPEVKVEQAYTNPSLSAHKVKLQSLSGQLRSAYRGLDIEWWDESGKGAMSDEGSGADGLYDDEDYGEGSGREAGVEGSGDDPDVYDDDDLVVPDWHKDRDISAWDPFKRSSTTTTTTTTTTSRPIVTAAAAPLRSKLTAVRALVTFFLPVITYYIGNVYTSLPFLFS